MGTEKSVRYKLTMRDGTSKALASARKGIKSTDSAFKSMTDGLTKMTIVGAGVSASLRNISRIGAAAAKNTVGEYVKFEKGMAEVATITDLTRGEMSKLGVETQNFARKYGIDATETARALYGTISAGIPATEGGAKAFDVMGASLKFGKAALVDAASATDLMTTILNSYQLEADQATNVSDALFTTIRLGKTTGEELAGSLGRVTSIASAAGVSFDDLTGGIVALTRAGLSTDETVTSLRQLLVSIVKPTEQSAEAVKELGLELFNEATLRQEGGLFKILGELNEKAGDSVGKLSTVIPNIRALTGALASAGQQDALPEILEQIANRGGATEVALKKMTETVGFSIDDLGASFDVLKQRMGEAAASNGTLQAAMTGAAEMVDKWADELLVSGEDGVGGINSFIESLVKEWVPNFLDGMASMILSMTQVGATGRTVIAGLIVLFDKLGWIVRKSAEGWQDYGLIIRKVWANLTRNEEWVAALEAEYAAMFAARAQAKKFRAEMELASKGNFDASEAGKAVAESMQALAEHLRNTEVEAKETTEAVDDLTNSVEDLGGAVAKVLGGGAPVEEIRDFAGELRVLKAEVFDYKQGMGDIPSAQQSWARSIQRLSRDLHTQGASLEDQVGAWEILRDAISGAWSRAHEGKSLSDVVGQVSIGVESAASHANVFEGTLRRIKALATGVMNSITLQSQAEAELVEEARILGRLQAVTGDTEKEILETKSRIRAEEEARSHAAELGLADVERYVDLSMKNYELAVLANDEEDRRLLTIRERVAEEQRAIEEYQRGIESMSSSATDSFDSIFSSWMAGQQSLSDGFNEFGDGLKASLSEAFLEPLIGADSLINDLFTEMFDLASQLGKSMINTVKGWFAEKATQRTLDATAGTAVHATTAATTAATTNVAVAAMIPALTVAATMALIASFGGAATSAALLEPTVAAQMGMMQAMAALADGGRVTSPTIAMIGEAGEETVIPDTRTGRARELLSDLASRRPELFEATGGGARQSGGGAVGGMTIPITVHGGGSDPEELARMIASEVDNVIGRRIGR